MKIKTPVCPALKKFFGATLDESQTLPTDISLQIVPSRHRDESYVSYLRQNPLLRANFSPSVPIRELLSFLHRKWSIPEVTDDVNPSQSPLYFYFGNRKLTSMQIVPGNTQQRVQNLISLERFIRTLTKPSEGQIPEPTESISCQAAGVDVEIAVVTKLETAGTDFLPVYVSPLLTVLLRNVS